MVFVCIDYGSIVQLAMRRMNVKRILSLTVHIDLIIEPTNHTQRYGLD